VGCTAVRIPPALKKTAYKANSLPLLRDDLAFETQPVEKVEEDRPPSTPVFGKALLQLPDQGDLLHLASLGEQRMHERFLRAKVTGALNGAPAEPRRRPWSWLGSPLTRGRGLFERRLGKPGSGAKHWLWQPVELMVSVGKRWM